VLIPYFPVRDENLKKIVRLKLAKIERRLREVQRVELVYDQTLVEAVAARCTEVESGARNVDNILSNTMLPELSRMLLESLSHGERPGTIRVSVDADGALQYDVTPAVRAGDYTLGGVDGITPAGDEVPAVISGG
jgi:type VI secretion system protein VasG